MIGDKQESYPGKAKDLASVQAHLEEYLKNDGFRVQASTPSEGGVVIQAQKGRILASLVDADRALTIALSPQGEDLNVHIGIGKWLEHLGIAAIETLLISDLFLVVDVAETAWNFEIEDKLLKDLRAFVA